tara:strand:- start:903 stop:3047 length:2145 start_codon:yes stop_codon:yes gene_type:complete
MKYIINFLFILFIIFKCSILNSKEIYDLRIPNNFQIKLENSENRRFIVNHIKAALSTPDKGHPDLIKQKYKKWFKGNLIVRDGKQIKNYKIKLRLMGDYKDHIDLESSRASLKISLLEDTLNGVKTFRLYLPNTRDDTNEVFINLLLKFVGFPTLFTKIVEVNFLDQKYRAIFQEEGSKEFLERNFFYEVPIIKTGEYHFGLNEISLKREKLIHSYILNNSGLLKKDNSTKVINEAIYLAHSKNFKNLIYQNVFFEKILTYLGGTDPHGLLKHNRRYIFLPLNRIFIPLYYDGNINYMNVSNNKCQKTKHQKTLSTFKKEYESLSKKKISDIEICIFNEIFDEYSKKYQNEENFFSNLPIENNEISPNDEIIFLRKIFNSYLKNEKNDYIKSFEELDKYYFEDKNSYKKCYFSTTEKTFKFCKNISLEQYKKISYKRPKIDKLGKIYSTNINIGQIDSNNIIKILLKTDLANNQIFLTEPLTYYINLNDLENSKEIVFKNINSRLVFFGDANNIELDILSNFDIEDIKIDFNRTNGQLLTGCVTFYNSELININLNFKNLFCEDSVNFLYSKGIIKNIKILNSLSDALDADFSKLTIENIIVENSKNDCSDFSFGNYSITNGYFQNCGDKALSFGEMSSGKIENIKIINSYDGVVSKDESIVEVSTVIAKNIKNYCFAAYNKKPEFKGGTLNVNSFECDGLNYNDLISKLYINE